MRKVRLTMLVAAASLCVAIPAQADKPASKRAGESKEAKAHSKTASAGKGESSKAGATPATAKSERSGKAGKGRERPGRPESSDDVSGKAKGLDKENRGKALGHDKDDEADSEGLAPEERAEKRKRRKKSRVQKLKMRWGKTLLHPSVQAELKVHARRMARLERIRRLAEAKEKDKVLERVEELLKKEEARHARHMVNLSTRARAGRGSALEKVGHGKDRGRGRALGKDKGVPGKAKALGKKEQKK